LAAGLEKRFELHRDVEVILDGVLSAARDEDDVRDARADGFFNAVLDDRLVDERQHFLRLRFGGREESGAEAGGGEHGLADGSHGRIVTYNADEAACSTRRTCATTSRKSGAAF